MIIVTIMIMIMITRETDPKCPPPPCNIPYPHIISTEHKIISPKLFEKCYPLSPYQKRFPKKSGNNPLITLYHDTEVLVR